MISEEILTQVDHDLLNTGEPHAAIAARYSISGATISRRAKEINAPKRHKGRCQGLSDETFLYLQLFADGQSESEAARTIGVTRQAASQARQRLIENGLLDDDMQVLQENT